MPIVQLSTKSAPNAGIFRLPPEANTEKFAFNWIKEGQAVEAAKQVQPILGTNYGADGWAVFTFPDNHAQKGRPCKVATSKEGNFILMQRPRSVQDDVNALYGNVSKQHLIREQSGESIAGQPLVDPGILSDARIKEGTGITEFGGETFNVPMNRVNVGPHVEASPEANVVTV